MSQKARAFPIAPVLLALAASGCPSSGNGSPNPATLWLSTDMDELHIKLVESEPPPF